MRYGITLLGDRVAPRPTCADAVFFVNLHRNHARPEMTVELPGHSLLDLSKVLSEHRVDMLVCGGISREERDYLAARRIGVVDNVAASVDELLVAFDTNSLQPGFGFGNQAGPGEGSQTKSEAAVGARCHSDDSEPPAIDCLACRNRVCEQGGGCSVTAFGAAGIVPDRQTVRTVEAALDISFENERTLCRLSELIYFCLDMNYRTIGLAYCTDLEEPAGILVRVMRRFFTVHPVCCKVGGTAFADLPVPTVSGAERSAGRHVACNPVAQASALNRLGTDLNVLVGLCMGADCVFARYSEAPVSTLFVKDKSLANNPIGAVYSDYYIKEAMQAEGSTEENRP